MEDVFPLLVAPAGLVLIGGISGHVGDGLPCSKCGIVAGDNQNTMKIRMVIVRV